MLVTFRGLVTIRGFWRRYTDVLLGDGWSQSLSSVFSLISFIITTNGDMSGHLRDHIIVSYIPAQCVGQEIPAR